MGLIVGGSVTLAAGVGGDTKLGIVVIGLGAGSIAGGSVIIK